MAEMMNIYGWGNERSSDKKPIEERGSMKREPTQNAFHGRCDHLIMGIDAPPQHYLHEKMIL
jgi:hypothetical protein